MAGLTTSLLLASGGISAASSIMGGEMSAKAAEQQAEYNAKLYGQQANMVTEKKKVHDYQYGRMFGQAMGANVAATAGKGLTMSGSPMAIMADTQSQILFDQAIGDYNLDVERNVALQNAEQARRVGEQEARQARIGGYTNAFTTMLSTGADVSFRNDISKSLKPSKTIYRPSYKLVGGRTYKSPLGNTYKH